nr:hypothetical protein [Tanacetum cinerariifolium]
MPRGHTWRTRPRPDPDRPRPTAHQPPLTVGPVVVKGGPAAVNGGSPTTTVVDQQRGGWTNGRMTRHHGTVAAAEGSVRGSVQGSEKSVRGQKNQYKDQKKSILEADVAQCDWWIKNPMMRYEE